MTCHRQFLVLTLTLAVASVASADAKPALRFAGLFGDHMVLLADSRLPVWGWAEPGSAVRVSLAGQERTATADASGKWRATFDPLPAGGPHTLAARVGESEVKADDVMIGEVWLGSGQSNMAMAMSGVMNADAEIASASHAQIRVFTVKQAMSSRPLDDVKGEWKVCTPATAGSFSATGYFFAREVHRELGKPVGMIIAAQGAAAGESFVSREKLESDPRTKVLVEKADERAAKVPAARAEFERLHAAWEQKMRDQGRASVLEKPRSFVEARAIGEPRPTSVLNDYQWASMLGNGTIAPLVPYAIRGVLWYQGEHNAKRAEQYGAILPLLVADWRERWANPDLPFLVVQLPGYGKRVDVPQKSAWAEMREAQARVLKLPHTGLAVTIDVGDEDVHPKNKQPVGRRLALQALKRVYGRDVVADGPMFAQAAREGDAMRVRFDVAKPGLSSRGGPPRGFELAGPDKTFVHADATIEPDGSVLVRSARVKEPVAVRYGWAENPDCNLYGPNDLPAAPFRTDDWPGVTTGVEFTE